VTENKSSWILINPGAIPSQTHPSQNVTKIHQELLRAILLKTSNASRQKTASLSQASFESISILCSDTVHYTTMLYTGSRHMYN